jgi:hypothetical protein
MAFFIYICVMENIINHFKVIAYSFLGVTLMDITSHYHIGFINLQSVELMVKTLIELCIGIITIVRLLYPNGTEKESTPGSIKRKYNFWRKKK